VFIGNIHAAGTAITLTAAHHVWFVEQDWVPGNNAQAIMRCHRIGQKNNVSVQFISLDNSLDHTIMLILKRKTRELTEIFD
jgi:SNF2 family DNA or RNA helicase